jgi:hypothetical protein
VNSTVPGSTFCGSTSPFTPYYIREWGIIVKDGNQGSARERAVKKKKNRRNEEK